MATVYKACARGDGSTFAIKVFHQSDPYLRDKFEQEIRIGTSLSHPHIARVYGGGTSSGLYYMVMEYVDNQSLRDRLRTGELPSYDAIISIIGQTCDALSYAHARGIIHRDIKPENIMFSSNGGIKLVDFGIAKLTNARTVTMEGTLVGTSYYMSYEAAQGLKVDPRSDLYSLGVVLYEMLTGQVPFKGEALTVVNKHIHELPVPPRQLRAEIPPMAEEVVMCALAKDATQRYQSAEQMARAIGYTSPFYVPTPEPVPAPPVGTVQQKSPALEPGAARLVVLRSGHVIPLTHPETIIERRNIVPPDSLVSRHHARVTIRSNQYWLEDLNSTNGTFLNEIRIFEPAVVRPGDTIRVGHTHLRIEQSSV